MTHQNEMGVVALQLQYTQIFQDLPVAAVCSQLHYWYTPDKRGKSKLRKEMDGHQWLVKSITEWSLECGITYKQARRSLDVLERVGVIERVNSLFAGRHTAHIRALRVPKGGVLKSGQFLIDALPAPEGSDPALEGSYPALEGISITETTQDTTQIQKEAGVPAMDNTKEEQPEGTYGKKDMATYTKTSTMLLKKLQEAKEEPIPTNKSKPKDLAMLWCKAVPRYVEGAQFIKPFTTVEWGHLSRLYKVLGDKAAPVLLTVIKRWIAFGKYTSTKAGAYNPPQAPQLGFLVKYIEQAMNFYIEDTKNIQPNSVTPKPKPVMDPTAKVTKNGAVNDTQLVTPIEEGPISYEDLLELDKLILNKPGGE